MSRQQDTKLTPDDAEFAARVAARLREDAGLLDAQTRSRLNRARQRALAELSPAIRWQRGPLLAGAVAAGVAALAVLLWRPVADAPPPVPDAPDLELLMTDESLDMLEDLEFYTWLAAAELDGGAAG